MVAALAPSSMVENGQQGSLDGGGAEAELHEKPLNGYMDRKWLVSVS